MYAAFRIALLLKKFLPFSMSKWVARRVADVWYIIFSERREAVLANLELIPNINRKKIKSIAKQVMRNFAEVVTEFLYLERLTAEEWEGLVDADSFEVLVEKISRRPAILVTGHIGNWELAACLISRLGCNICVVVYDNPDPRVASLFRSIRLKMGLRVVSTSEAARTLREIAATHSIGVVADRDYSGRGLETQFFNLKVKMPVGYASLAISQRIPVYCGFLIKHKDGKYRLTDLEKIYDPQAPSDLSSIAERFTKKLETITAQHPQQWYLFEKVTEVSRP